jgi:hypothetical protein
MGEELEIHSIWSVAIRLHQRHGRVCPGHPSLQIKAGRGCPHKAGHDTEPTPDRAFSMKSGAAFDQSGIAAIFFSEQDLGLPCRA